jgi:hypothetical protein
VPTFVDRVVSRGQRGGSPPVVKLSLLDRMKPRNVYLKETTPAIANLKPNDGDPRNHRLYGWDLIHPRFLFGHVPYFHAFSTTILYESFIYAYVLHV